MKPSLISHKSSLLFYCAFLSVTALLGSVNLLEAQTYTSVYGFSLYSGFPPANADGALPYGGVVVSGNVIYGTTFEGGTNGEGTIFAVNTDGTGFTNLHTFASLVPFPGGTNSDGAAPHARLLLSGNTLYGTTSAGGPGGYGTVFKLNTNGAGFTNLHVFSASFTDGAYPNAGLILSGSRLYGTSSMGGSGTYGTVFSLKTDGTGYTNVYNFTAFGDGAEPQGEVLLSGGTLYGTTSGGGTNKGMGVIFSVKTNGTSFKTLYTFAATGTKNTNSTGATPEAGLVIAGNTLYGTTHLGGTNGDGVVFSLHTDGSGYTKLHEFAHGASNGTYFTNADGAHPECTLVLAGSTLYGTTLDGGSNGLGTVFSIDASGSAFANNYIFEFIIDADFLNEGGINPYAGLTLSGNVLYGTSEIGGGYDGNVYALSGLVTAPVAPTITSTSPLPDGMLGTAYDQQLAATGGTLPYTWKIISGHLMAGLTLSTNGLISGTPTAGGTTNFTVTVTGNDGLSSTQDFSLVIIVPDTRIPTLTITSPVASQKWSNAVFTVHGKCSDNVAVAGVFISANSNGWSPASLDTSTNWSADVNLTPGTNTIFAYAVDTSGNVSVTNSVKLIYILSTTLTVSTNGRGTLTPNYNGANLQIGISYSMTAKASTGFGFVSWTDGLGGVITNGAILKFIMASNLDFVANFKDLTKPLLTITNPIKTGLKWSNDQFTVKGKCSDNVGVSNVWLSLNGAAWINPTLSGSNWLQLVTLVPGTNTFAAYAVDAAGNKSLTNTTKLIYVLTAPLVVSTNGRGTITPAYNGAHLQIGIGYSMTAKAAAGFGFVNWTDGLGGVITNGAILKFVMASNLDFVANFKDITKPTLTITAPVANQKWSNALFNVSGKCADNVAVSNVWLSLNGADWALTSLSGGSNWLQQVTLVPGTNSVSVYAEDAAGNVSLTNTVKLVYFPSEITLAGLWNLVQLQTPSQIFIDGDNNLQGGGSFSIGTGSFALDTNGTLSGALGDPFTGAYLADSNGVVSVTITNSSGTQPIVFYWTPTTTIRKSSSRNGCRRLSPSRMSPVPGICCNSRPPPRSVLIP
jgi:uncharacterized repeat protein (TIGR03803 family)